MFLLKIKLIYSKIYHNTAIIATPNLLEFEKQVVIYYLPNQRFYCFKKKCELKEFLMTNVKLDSKLKKLLNAKDVKSFFQICLF